MSEINKPIGIGIVGCGNISDYYIRAIRAYPNLNLIGVTDIDQFKALQKSRDHNTLFFRCLEDLVKDSRIQIVVVLTIHQSHYSVSKTCLQAGLHVYCEKPIALSTAQATDLIITSQQVNKRLACAPINYMGEAQQTAWKLISTGALGNVRVAYAEVNWGRIETWHPNPLPFYEVGPLWDVGIYPITLLTAIFGPIKTITAQNRVILPNRKTKAGLNFQISTPDFYLAILEFVNGLVVRLTTDFYIERTTKFNGLEIFGDEASIYLSSWHDFNAGVEFKPYGEDYQTVPLIRVPQLIESKVDWARGIADLANAIVNNKPHRASSEHALHVVEVMEKISLFSPNQNTPVEITSTFSKPSLMNWAQ